MSPTDEALHHFKRLDCDQRQRLRVPLPGVHLSARAPGRSAPAHPRWTTNVKRPRRASAADDPRGVLAPGLRQGARAQEHGAQAGPRAVPAHLQLRQGTHRTTDTWESPRRDRLRCSQDGSCPMSGCRYISGVGQARRLIASVSPSCACANSAWRSCWCGPPVRFRSSPL